MPRTSQPVPLKGLHAKDLVSRDSSHDDKKDKYSKGQEQTQAIETYPLQADASEIPITHASAQDDIADSAPQKKRKDYKEKCKHRDGRRKCKGIDKQSKRQPRCGFAPCVAGYILCCILHSQWPRGYRFDLDKALAGLMNH
jgi:uncharacterized protein YgiB involved in biofilm formation